MIASVIVTFGMNTELSKQNTLYIHKENIDTRGNIRHHINN